MLALLAVDLLWLERLTDVRPAPMLYHPTIVRALWLVPLIVLGCSDDSGTGAGSGLVKGPEGAYDDTDVRCSLYDPPDHLCQDSEYFYLFVCDERPGESCVESTEPTPSPGREPWCCESRCHRSTEDSDEWCTDGRDAWICYGTPEELDAFADAESCVVSSQSRLICC